MQEVVALVRLDPSISARVLQIGNSVCYSHGSRCYTVDEAVNRVGFDPIFEIVGTTVATQVLIRPMMAYGMEVDDFWKNSVATALAAEIIAEQIGADRDIAYTIGLLHGLGMLAIDEWAFRSQPTLQLSSRGLPLETCEAERVALGFHNAEVGAAMMRQWDFPSVMTEPVRWQYLPRGTLAHQRLASLLNAAKWLRCAASPRERIQAPDTTVLSFLKLSARHIEGFIPELCSRIQNSHTLLEVGERGSTPLPFPGGVRHIEDSVDSPDRLAM